MSFKQYIKTKLNDQRKAEDEELICFVNAGINAKQNHKIFIAKYDIKMGYMVMSKFRFLRGVWLHCKQFSGSLTFRNLSLFFLQQTQIIFKLLWPPSCIVLIPQHAALLWSAIVTCSDAAHAPQLCSYSVKRLSFTPPTSLPPSLYLSPPICCEFSVCLLKGRLHTHFLLQR